LFICATPSPQKDGRARWGAMPVLRQREGVSVTPPRCTGGAPPALRFLALLPALPVAPLLVGSGFLLRLAGPAALGSQLGRLWFARPTGLTVQVAEIIVSDGPVDEGLPGRFRVAEVDLRPVVHPQQRYLPAMYPVPALRGRAAHIVVFLPRSRIGGPPGDQVFERRDACPVVGPPVEGGEVVGRHVPGGRAHKSARQISLRIGLDQRLSQWI